ncbi:MAG: hypothetical protein DCF21_08895 [Leptolyngbya sp.]|jgi:predicted HTH domain antitoxin|uniref:Uncharacterized protein n=1 Tax=Shackletoniella antarctica TaxID=268115 RepID=A0A2W4WEU4_9CYAN|nr:MAG: hypothetical protein DCF17_11720 [Shackletoniella antarctica]PZV17919.1 MAG: hypothetical protein DCF21_08895 [Leptolyngbya sp.]
MNDLTVSLQVPRDLLGTLDVSEKQMAGQLLELVALELFRQGRISTGKGAELLGISKWGFVQILSRHTIPYFTDSPEELELEVNVAEALLD